MLLCCCSSDTLMFPCWARTFPSSRSNWRVDLLTFTPRNQRHGFFSACVDTLTFQAFFFLLPSPVVTFRDRGRGSGVINSAFFFPLVLLRCASGFSFLLSLNKAPNQLDGVMRTLCMFNLSTVSGCCCVCNGCDRCAFFPRLADAAHG